PTAHGVFQFNRGNGGSPQFTDDNTRCGISKIARLFQSVPRRQAVASARKRGEKVVMTNGVFDILHAGHVSYLANARKLGDRLI
ncbi:adenylyltransferase/cytidyltransferase family protein, partial [Citrobacter braakii]|uniref:adenylyltransferase/cytidyltransferase family protein n=1 Tax=Citrobacter braakii TaxID=57706 RepID=UPI00374F5C3C